MAPGSPWPRGGRDRSPRSPRSCSAGRWRRSRPTSSGLAADLRAARLGRSEQLHHRPRTAPGDSSRSRSPAPAGPPRMRAVARHREGRRPGPGSVPPRPVPPERIMGPRSNSRLLVMPVNLEPGRRRAVRPLNRLHDHSVVKEIAMSHAPEERVPADDTRPAPARGAGATTNPGRAGACPPGRARAAEGGRQVDARDRNCRWTKVQWSRVHAIRHSAGTGRVDSCERVMRASLESPVSPSRWV